MKSSASAPAVTRPASPASSAGSACAPTVTCCPGRSADLEAWPVEVVGFGYVNHVWDYRYRYLNQAPQNGGPYGPFLYLNELMSSLASAHGLQHRDGAGPVRHLCWPCLYTAVPDTAERIANGLMCETPKCVSEPCERCRCCGGAFCEACMIAAQVQPQRAMQDHLGRTGRRTGRRGQRATARSCGSSGRPSTAASFPRCRAGCAGYAATSGSTCRKRCRKQIVGERYAGILVPAPPAPPGAAGQTRARAPRPSSCRPSSGGPAGGAWRSGPGPARCWSSACAEIAGNWAASACPVPARVGVRTGPGVRVLRSCWTSGAR